MFRRLAARPYLGTCVPGGCAVIGLGRLQSCFGFAAGVSVESKLTQNGLPFKEFSWILQKQPVKHWEAISFARNFRGIILRQKPSWSQLHCGQAMAETAFGAWHRPPQQSKRMGFEVGRRKLAHRGPKGRSSPTACLCRTSYRAAGRHCVVAGTAGFVIQPLASLV